MPYNPALDQAIAMLMEIASRTVCSSDLEKLSKCAEENKISTESAAARDPRCVEHMKAHSKCLSDSLYRDVMTTCIKMPNCQPKRIEFELCKKGADAKNLMSDANVPVDKKASAPLSVPSECLEQYSHVLICGAREMLKDLDAQNNTVQ
eukprot:PhM_4_TR17838/c0_g1_i1/m.17219